MNARLVPGSALVFVPALALACSAGGTDGGSETGMTNGTMQPNTGLQTPTAGSPGVQDPTQPPPAQAGSTAMPTGGAPGGAGAPSTGGSVAVPSAGSPATAGAAAGGAAPTAGNACGMGRTPAAGAMIDNFDGMSQVLEWRTADQMNTAGTVVMPTGSLVVPVTGLETSAAGALATWAAMDRPCMDASMYTGISFTVSGNVTKLLVRIGTPASYPAAEGGACGSPGCAYAHYEKDVTAAMAAGSATVLFSELAPPSWGMGLAPFDPSALISLVFLAPDDTDTTHSFTIDEITFQ